MKKSLFALAAMSAFAGAVQAQSSVTVYGIVDESVASSQTKQTNSTKVTNDSIASGIASTSRLGFRGVEDLGGGLTASFTAEAGMNAATSGSGGLLSTSATSGNRQTFVRLDKKGMGAVYGGYHVTDTHSVRATNDPFGGINLPGNPIVGVSLGNIAASQTIATNLYPVLGTASATVAGGTATNNDYILRAPLIGFTTAIAGVTLTYQRAQANSVSITSANVETPTRSNGNTFGARYTLGKLNVLAAYNDTVNQTAITTTNNNRKVQNTTVGANYDFGVARIYATYSNDQMKFDDATLANNNDVKNTNTQVAVQAPIGAVTLRAGYTTGKYTLGRTQAASGGLGGARDTSGYQAGVFYGLSKRTDIYAAYGSQSRKVISTLVDATDTAYAVGVRHTF